MVQSGWKVRTKEKMKDKNERKLVPAVIIQPISYEK